MANPICRQISRLDFSGNLVPLSWHQHIHTTHGRVDLGAISILSEIVFWYRWRQIRDEKTGRVTEVQQRFAGARFQRSLRHWSEFTGLTVKQVRRSLATLSRLGLVRMSYTRGRTRDRIACMAFEPVPTRLERITYPFSLEGTTSAYAPGGTTYAPGGIASPQRTRQKSLSRAKESSGVGRSSNIAYPDRQTGRTGSNWQRVGPLAAREVGRQS